MDTGRTLDSYRQRPGSKGYKVEHLPGRECPWCLVMMVDGEVVGSGQYQTAEQADDAGVDFMFSGWLATSGGRSG